MKDDFTQVEVTRGLVELLSELPFAEAKSGWVAVFERHYLEILMARHGALREAARAAGLPPEDLKLLALGYGVPVPEAESPMTRLLDGPFKEAKGRVVGDFERLYIADRLEANGFNISQAAKDAGVDRKYFRKLMKRYGLFPEDADA